MAFTMINRGTDDHSRCGKRSRTDGPASCLDVAPDKVVPGGLIAPVPATYRGARWAKPHPVVKGRRGHRDRSGPSPWRWWPALGRSPTLPWAP